MLFGSWLTFHPTGVFIRKYVPELRAVPDKYIHEPWKLPPSLQDELGVHIGSDYPLPIVNEQESAKVAKQRVSDVRKQSETKALAQQVFQKHGSRSRSRPDRVPAPATKKAKPAPPQQPSIKSFFTVATQTSPRIATKPPAKKLTSQTAPSSICKDPWSGAACTFLNHNPRALSCAMCGASRS